MTSARDDILAAVRHALVGVHADPTPVVTPRSSRTGDAGRTGDLVELFMERVADYRAVIERCSEAELSARVAEALRGSTRKVVPAGLGVAVDGAETDHGLSANELDAVDAVVTEASVAIAETGTFVLEHVAGQGRRAISLVPDRHVCIVRVDQIVPDVPDALAVLDPGRPQTWVSGPSATSDIELSRVEGVHGPRNLHVIVVTPDSKASLGG